MAEPRSIGYKRRKGLGDLQQENDLYEESQDGIVDVNNPNSRSVLASYHASEELAPDLRFGFWSRLGAIGSRSALRLDPKYRWFWDYREGVAFGDPSSATPLAEILEIVKTSKVAKGELEEATLLLDLESIESRQGFVRRDAPTVEFIGSDRVSFSGCELAIAKLEPYLGKLILKPPSNAIGSPEWIGLRRRVKTLRLWLPGRCQGCQFFDLYKFPIYGITLA